MTMSSTKIWFHRVFPALMLAALIACGGNKKTGDNAAAPELNPQDVPKVSTTDNSTGKDTSTGNESDICDKSNDAYAMYAKATNHQKDYVMKKAKDMGFDALYTAKPAAFAIEDYKVMHNYFVKTDAVYAKLSMEIEFKMAAAQKYASDLAGKDANTPAEDSYIGFARKDRFSDMYMMLEARRNLFNYYANIFGMANAVTWFNANDLDDQLATATKDYTEKLAANTYVTAAERTEVARGMVEAARGVVMQAKDKDYVLHTVFMKDTKDFAIEVVEVNAQSVGFGATYKKYADEDIKAAMELSATYTKQIESMKASFVEAKKADATQAAPAAAAPAPAKTEPAKVEKDKAATVTAPADIAAQVEEFVELAYARDLVDSFIAYVRVGGRELRTNDAAMRYPDGQDGSTVVNTDESSKGVVVAPTSNDTVKGIIELKDKTTSTVTNTGK